MAAKKYIAINEASTGMEERDLLKDVGEFAYANQQEITAPFDVHDLAIGSYKFVGENWDDVLHPPVKLPSGGHFQIFVGDNSKQITYTVPPSEEEHSSDCTRTRSAGLVITDGDAEEWMYYAQGKADDYGRTRIPANWDQGRALDLDERVYNSDFIDEMAWLDRGEFSGAVNFNRLTFSGLYNIRNIGGWVANKSTFYPPSTVPDGLLEVKSVGCRVMQFFYPNDAAKTGLLLREKGENGTWSAWFTANEGDMMVGTDKVRISTFMRRGIGSGKATVELYRADGADKKFTYTPGYGIAINNNVISWTGLTVSVFGVSPINYNPSTGAISLGALAISNTTGLQAALDSKLSSEIDPTVPAWVKAITSTQISNWNSAYSWGNHSGLYSLLGHTHAWTEITGKPTTFTPEAHTHPYTEVTGIAAGTGITYTGGVIASTITQYTDAMARGSISGGGLLSYNSTTGLMSLASVPWANITGAPDFSGAYVPLTRALTVEGTSGRISVAGGAQTLAAARTWTVDLAAIHAGLSGGSTTKTLSSLSVDPYGRTTSALFSDIAFPVTSVNGLTGAVSLTTSHIPEGTNLYWTNARGDARYSLLGHGHVWTEISGKPLTFNPSSHTHPYTEVTGISAGAGITYIGGVIASTITQYTDALAKAALSAGAGISYGIVSGIIALASIHAGISGGSTTKTLSSLGVDQYGRTTSAVFSDIAFPVTSVNGKTGAAVLYTDDVSDVGRTNKYYTDAQVAAYGDAHYSLLGHTHNFTLLVGKPTTLAGYGITDGVSGSGTANVLPKFSAGTTLTNSQISDDGTYVKIGSTSSIGKLNIAGAVWASADGSAVSYYVAGGGAVRAFGTMYLDAYEGDINLRAGAYTLTVVAKSTGQVRFPTYTSSSSWSGTAAGLLGFDSSGNILTYEAVRTNAQNDARYLQSIGSHGHIIGDVSGLQSALDGKTPYGHGHIISDVSGLQSALDGKPAWSDVYTRTQLNTSGGGGIVHWDNISGKPGTFPPTYHTHSISEVVGLWGELDGKSNVGHGHIISDISGLQTALDGKTPYGHGHNISDISGLQTALDGKTPYGHGHNISDVSGLQSALDGKADWGHNHDDLYYREYEVNSLLSGKANNSHGHWYTDIGGAPWITGYTETDPWGISGIYANMEGGNMRITVYMRGGGNFQTVVTVFSGG